LFVRSFVRLFVRSFVFHLFVCAEFFNTILLSALEQNVVANDSASVSASHTTHAHARTCTHMHAHARTSLRICLPLPVPVCCSHTSILHLCATQCRGQLLFVCLVVRWVG
jgi:hypothetical protein